jgi:hypothetical protein
MKEYELIEIHSADESQLPFTKKTIYKLRSQKRYQHIFVRVCNKIFFNKTAWNEEVEKEVNNAQRNGVVDVLSKLSDEERLSIFNKFCKYCGGIDPRCDCMRDE